jgi:hypothetical protein
VILAASIGGATKAVLLASAGMFLWALLLGTWKYRQIATSEDGLAHPYVDIAHRAALPLMVTLIVAEIGGWLVLIAGFLDGQVF